MKETKVIQEGKMRDAIIDFLIDLPLFDKLKTSELRFIVKRMNFIEIDKGEILFKEGDKVNSPRLERRGITIGIPCDADQ